MKPHSNLNSHSNCIYLQVQLSRGHYKIYFQMKKLTTPKKIHRINNPREANQNRREKNSHDKELMENDKYSLLITQNQCSWVSNKKTTSNTMDAKVGPMLLLHQRNTP